MRQTFLVRRSSIVAMRAQRELGFQTDPARPINAPQTRTEMAEIFFTGTQKQIAWLVLLFLASTVACASAQTEGAVPTGNIVARMAQAREENDARFRPYI